jgi:uncharacterized protein YlbG (UPF0298 family)
VSYDIVDMSTINVEIRKQIKIMYNNDISVDEVIEGVQRLKLGKSIGEEARRYTQTGYSSTTFSN